MDRTASPVVESEAAEPLAWLKTDTRLNFAFSVAGAPKPKARARTVRNRKSGLVHTFTPFTTVNWERAIVNQVKQALDWVSVHYPDELGVLPLTGRVITDMRFNIAKPKSSPKSMQYPLKSRSGDIDNLAKSVLDALQIAGVISDDKTVTDLIASKRFVDVGHAEGVQVALVAWLPNPEI